VTAPLFLDLDGVLADFDAGVRATTGRPPGDLTSRAMWKALAAHPDFYGTLDMMADARDLWAFCAPFRPTILTGLPMGRWAEPQKRAWVARVLGADVPVVACLSREKHRWSGPGHVLVDDRVSLREAWVAAGGTFVPHTDAAASIEALRRRGFGEPSAPADG
jgi:hypothetical protein